MTRTKLQQAIKAIRQTDGTAQTPALNSKTIVLQDWLDNYNERSARQQAALDEATELFDEVEPTTESNEIPDHVTDEVALIVADDILEDNYGYIRTEELSIAGLPVKIDCYEYGYKPSIAWDGSNFEVIEYRMMPGSLTSLKAELTEMIEVLSPISGSCYLWERKWWISGDLERQGYDEQTSHYWYNWNAAYESAIATLERATSKITGKQQCITAHHEDITRAHCSTEVIQSEVVEQKTTAVNHGEVGVIVAVLMLEFIKIALTLVTPFIALAYITIRRASINHALIYDSFKSAALLAKQTPQTA